MYTLLIILILVVIVFLWAMPVGIRTIIPAFVFVLFWVISTEAFYRLLFVQNSFYGKDSHCAVIVSNGGDIVESAVLLLSLKRLGIANLYIHSLVSDATLPAQLNDYFMSDQNVKFIHHEVPSDQKFKNCVFAYPPQLYCSVMDIGRKYTLLPQERFPYIPNAEFLSINTDTIDHCISKVILHNR